MTEPAPKRDWLRIVVTTVGVVAILGGWLGYQFNWMRQRHAVLAQPEVLAYVSGVEGVSPQQVAAPFPLWLFKEPGCYLISYAIADDDRATRWDASEPNVLLSRDELARLERFKSLFPEASVVTGMIVTQKDYDDHVNKLRAAAEQGQPAGK